MRIQIYTFLLVIICIPAGLSSKFYNGPGAFWINNSLGGVIYEIFWCLLIFLIFPKFRTLFIITSVFMITSILEILQLYHPPVLEAIRNTFIGRTLIGTTFAWSDFIYYILGCGISYAIIFKFKKVSSITSNQCPRTADRP